MARVQGTFIEAVERDETTKLCCTLVLHADMPGARSLMLVGANRLLTMLALISKRMELMFFGMYIFGGGAPLHWSQCDCHQCSDAQSRQWQGESETGKCENNVI